MNFDNLARYDLMTGFHRFIPFLLILLFWHWQYSLDCVIQLGDRISYLFNWNIVWSKSEVKREYRDLCKMKKAIKR